MPQIGRIKLANIGVSKIFMEDLTLNCFGENTVIYLENGGGKSSIISLLFSLLRPYSYDFLGSPINRSLSDYILQNIPAHIIIEWILDDNRRTEFFLTGVVILRKQDNSLSQVFYSLKYPSEVTSHVSFDNLNIKKDEGFLSQSDIISFLRRKKREIPSQDIKIFNNEIGKWIQHLNDNLIDSDLIKVQINMNKREGGQDSILDFQNDYEFIRFLVRNLANFKEDDLDLKEIKDVYDNVKELPKLEAQSEFITQLIEILEQGKPLEDEVLNLEKEIIVLMDIWERIKVFIENSLRSVSDDLQHSSIELEDSMKNRKALELKIMENSEKIAFLKHTKNSILISGLESEITENIIKNESLLQEKSFLEILPDFQKHKEKKILYNQHNERLLEKSAPIKDQLERNRQYNFFYCKQLKEKEQNDLKFYRDELKNCKEKQNEINQRLGGLKQEVKINTKDIKDFTKIINDINKEEEKIAHYLYADNDLIKSITHCDQKNENLKEIIKSKEDCLDKLNEEIEEKRDIQDNNKEKLSQIQRIRDVLEEKLEVRLNTWKELTSYPNFMLLFGSEWREQPPNYDILNLDKLNQIEKEINIIDQNIFKISPKYAELNKKIERFEETGQLPYNENTQTLIDFLKDNNLDYWIGTGWDYLTINFKDVNKIKEISEKIPHLLEGIVVNLKNLNELKEILENNKDIKEFKNLIESVFISSPEIFKNNQLENTKNNSIIFSPDLRFRYDNQELNSLIENFKGILKNFNNIINKNKKQLDLYKNLKGNWESFLQNYPNTKYLEFTEELKNRQEDLDKISHDIDIIDLDIRKLTSKRDNLVKEIQIKRIESENIQIALNQLSEFRPKYEKKKELREQIQIKKNAIEQERLEELELDERISDLREQEDTDLTAIQEIEEKLKDFEIKLRELKTSFSKQIKIDQQEIKSFIRDKTFEICWKLFTEIKAQYDHILNESEIKQIILSLGEDIAQLKKKIEIFCNNKKISIESQEFLDIYNENLSYVQILDRKKLKENSIGNLKTQISDQKKQKANLTKENINLAKEFNFEASNLQVYYKEILQEKKIIIEQLEELQNEYESYKENMLNLINLIDNLEDKLKYLNQNRDSFNTLKILTESNLTKIIDVRTLEELKIQEYIDIGIKSLEDLNNLIEDEQGKLADALHRIKEKDKKIKEFINKVKSLNEKTIVNLEDIRIKEFIQEFNSQHIPKLSSYISKLIKRLEQINECIKAPKERLSNIVKIYSGLVDDTITKIINLGKVRLPIPELSHLNNRQIVKIPISSRDEVTGTVENYFKELFETHSKFPGDLTKGEIINNIIDNYLRIRMRTIKFLFPEKSQTVSYEPITKLIKSSGGEKLTVAIMLYCLIAHYRMKYLGIRKHNISYPLIMDNPIGTASRADLISMQVSLAKHLKIQLITFTHVSEVEALHQYYNFVTLKRSVSERNTFQIDVKNEEPPQILQGGFVKIRPKMVQHFQKIDVYLGDQD